MSKWGEMFFVSVRGCVCELSADGISCELGRWPVDDGVVQPWSIHLKEKIFLEGATFVHYRYPGRRIYHGVMKTQGDVPPRRYGRSGGNLYLVAEYTLSPILLLFRYTQCEVYTSRSWEPMEG